MIAVKRVQFKQMISTTWLNETSLDVTRGEGMLDIHYSREHREFVIIDKHPNIDRQPVCVPIENVASYEPLAAQVTVDEQIAKKKLASAR